jgi:nucleoid DNA-binding protein
MARAATTSRKSAAKKKTATKAATKKAATKKVTTKKAATKKAAPKKTATRTAAVEKKAPARKAAAPKKKATAGAAAPKKAATRQAAAPARKAAPKKAARKPAAIREPYTKVQLIDEISENTGLTKQDVTRVMDEMYDIIERHLKKRAAGVFTLPGLLKIRAAKKKATKPRRGRNPLTGEEITIPAKPARTVVRVSPLKNLKEMVE